MVKLKGSTIIETIIAMLIIMLVFLCAGLTMVNIAKTGISEKKLRANQVLNNYLDTFLLEKLPLDSRENVNDFLITITGETYTAKPGAAIIYGRVYDEDGKITAEQKRIMIIPNTVK